MLRDGTLVIANGGNQEVLLIREDGQLLRTVGREGTGPGEFKAVTSLHETADGFSAYDARLARFTQFDSTGAVLGTRSLRPPNFAVDLLPLLASPGGPDLAVYGSQRIGKGHGIGQDTTPLLLYRRAESQPDTLGLWAAEEANYTSFPTGGWARSPVGFGRHLAASGRSGRVVLGTTDSLNATVLDASGHIVLRLVGRFSGAPASTSDGEAWKTEFVSGLSDDMPEQLRDAFKAAPYRDTYPASCVGVRPCGAAGDFPRGRGLMIAMRRVVFAGLLPFVCACHGSGAPSTEVGGTPVTVGTSIVVPSTVFGTDQRVTVYLPTGYDRDGGRYPVVYATHSRAMHLAGALADLAESQIPSTCAFSKL